MKRNRFSQLLRFTLAAAFSSVVLSSAAPVAHGQQSSEPYLVETLSPAQPYSQIAAPNGLTPLPPLQQFPTQSTAVPWPAAPAPSPAATDASDPNHLRLASFPRDATEPLLDQPNNFVLIPEAQQPSMPPQRAGMFQRIAATTTYLPRFDENTGVGFEDTEIYAVFGVPFPTRDMPLLIEPGTDFWVLDAPGFNLPPNVHDDYLEFHWLGKLNDCWAADLMVTPGWHSDYQNSNGSQAFRLESHAVVAYSWSPTLKIAVGAAYWGRLNANVVPAGGIIWTPNADTRFELITPKPRIAYRVDCGQDFERWAYIAGEFGGGQWAIEQTPGFDNQVNYSDYRVMLGVEHKSLNLGLNGFAEIGYVFGRQLEYQYLLPDQNLPSTMMVRLGVSY